MLWKIINFGSFSDIPLEESSRLAFLCIFFLKRHKQAHSSMQSSASVQRCESVSVTSSPPAATQEFRAAAAAAAAAARPDKSPFKMLASSQG